MGIPFILSSQRVDKRRRCMKCISVALLLDLTPVPLPEIPVLLHHLLESRGSSTMANSRVFMTSYR